VWADEGSHPPVKLDRPVCVIGRRENGVNLPLSSPQVSKMHALVVRDIHGVYVRDLASTNGVERNGVPVQEAGLSDEDILRIGSYTFRCDSGFSHEDTEDTLPAAELIGEGLKFAFPAGQQTVLIGRRQGCDLVINEDGVAPVHAIVFQLDGQRYVRDLGTPGRTRINGRRVHQEALRAGDELRIGGMTMRYAMLDVLREEDAPPLDGPEIPGLDEPQIATVDEEPLPTELEESRIPLLDESSASVVAESQPELASAAEQVRSAEPPLAAMEESGIPLLDQSGTSVMAEPVFEPEPAAMQPPAEARLEAESRIPLHDSLVSIEDSQAAGTPDVGPLDSNILEPHPAPEPSFHGEVVEFGVDVIPINTVAAEAPEPVDDARRPMGSHVDDVHLPLPKPAKRAKRSNSSPKKSRRKPKR
jgi:pSer/pThr/pTyr-binding forkhead associated (FHA) protein